MTIGPRWVLAALLLVGLSALAGCNKEETSQKLAPVIERTSVQPATVLPSGTATLTCVAHDPNKEDSLAYHWSAAAGSFSGSTDQATVQWTAPRRTGMFPVVVEVNNAYEMVTDTAFVNVGSPLSATIVQPGDSSYFASTDTIVFAGWIEGFANVQVFSASVNWESDRDGLLFSGTPDSLGTSVFKGVLSPGEHHISMNATVNYSIDVSDTAVVTVYETSPLLLYPISRNYTSNGLTWTHVSDLEEYRVVRETASGHEVIARITDAMDTTYIDTNLVLGQMYSYHIEAKNIAGLTILSNPRTIEAGVYTDFVSDVKDMYYDEPNEYLYVSTPGDDKVWEIDVTANNLDYYFFFNDTLPGEENPIQFIPSGFALNPDDRTLYVASPGDSAVWRIGLDGPPWFSRIVDLRPNGTKPLYLAYDDVNQTLYATANNREPLVIQDPDGTPTVTSIQDSRLIMNESYALVDAPNNLLYISEIGNFPATLYKYDISTATPSLLLESDHNTIGYFLWDMALTQDGSRLLVACESPHYVQILNTDNFHMPASLPTGPSPNTVYIADDGTTVYTASGTTLQKWDLPSRTLIGTMEFADPISRDGIVTSADQQILMVTTTTGGGASKVFIVYLQ